MKMLYTFIILNSFSSPVEPTKALLIISFPRFKYLLMPVHLIFIHFSLFNCSGVFKISRRFLLTLCFCSSSFEDVISFKPFNSSFANYILCSLQIPSHAGAPHIQSFLAIQLFWSAQDISKTHVSTLHSFKIFRGCSLIQAF